MIVGLFGIPAVWMPVFIFLARIVDVSLGTMRMICLTRGQRVPAMLLGFFEILVWVVAVSSVFAHLNNWLNILAFAGGFAMGNGVGMFIEHKLAMGTQLVTMISRSCHNAVAERLRFADVLVTTLPASGREGPVSISQVIVPRRYASRIVQWAREIDPDVIFTISDVRDGMVRQPFIPLSGKFPFRVTPTPPMRRCG